MPTKASAIDIIAPAFEQTKRQLFQPFQFGRWARLGMIAVLTGEFLNGGSGGTSNFNFPTSAESGKKLSLLASPLPERLLEYLPLIVAAMVLLLVLWFVWTYVESVARFLLFDAVLRAKYEIREGWREWKPAGWSYFLWQMGFDSAMLAGLAVIAGIPALLCWRAGMFDKPDEHIGALIGYGGLVIVAIMVVTFVGMLISLLARDFVVPVMAMENVRVLEAWRRLLPMLSGEKGACTLYVLMKIVLSVGSAIMFGILNVIVFVCLAIPVGIVGGLLYVAAKMSHFEWNAYSMAAAGVLGVAALFGLFYVIGVVYAPGLLFFQSYALRFLGARYEKLGAALAETANPVAGPVTGAAPEPSPSSP